MDWHPIQGGVEILLVASCHGNRDKLRPGGPLGSYADFTYLPAKQQREIAKLRFYEERQHLRINFYFLP